MRSFYFILIVFIFSSCKQNNSTADKPAEQLLDSVYTINGIVEGAEGGSFAILQFLGTERKPDTVNITGDEFEFKGKASESLVADIYILQGVSKSAKGLPIVVENSVINIEGKKDSLHKAVVIGGISNNDFNTLKKALLVYDDSLDLVRFRTEQARVAGDSVLIDKLSTEYFNIENEKNTTIKQFAIEHPKNIAGAYYATSVNLFTLVELDSIYNAFDSSIINHIYVKQIKQNIDAIKRTSIGQVAPDFEMTDVNRKAFNLFSIRNKYVFINFWASWCAQCRIENPGLIKVYNKYKGKNFEIVGISLDSTKQDWTQAIKKDKLKWLQVSDLKTWTSSAALLYGIKKLPSNILLDKQGEIIARDISANQLEKTLFEVLK